MRVRFIRVSLMFLCSWMPFFATAETQTDTLVWTTQKSTPQLSQVVHQLTSPPVSTGREVVRLQRILSEVWYAYRTQTRVDELKIAKPVLFVTLNSAPLVQTLRNGAKFIEVGVSFSKLVSDEELRFILAHEIAHYLFHKPTSIKLIRIFDAKGELVSKTRLIDIRDRFNEITNQSFRIDPNLGLFASPKIFKVLQTTVYNFEIDEAAASCLSANHAGTQSLLILERLFVSSVDKKYQTLPPEVVRQLGSMSRAIVAGLNTCKQLLNKKNAIEFRNYLSDLIPEPDENFINNLVSSVSYVSDTLKVFEDLRKGLGFQLSEWPGFYTSEDQADDVALTVLDRAKLNYNFDFIRSITAFDGSVQRVSPSCEEKTSALVFIDEHRLPCDRHFRLLKQGSRATFSNL